MQDLSPLRSAGLMAVILFLSLGVNVIGVSWGLPETWCDDENLTAREAVHMFQNRNLCPAAYYYGTLPKYAMLLYFAPYLVCTKAHGLKSNPLEDLPGVYYFLGRIFIALIAALAAVLFYRFLLKICSSPIAFSTALMLALSPVYVYSAHLIKNTAFLVLLFLLIALLSAQFIISGKRKFLYLASLVCGMNVAVQITGVFAAFLVLVPTVSYLLGKLDPKPGPKAFKETAGIFVREGIAFGLGLGLTYPCALLHPTRAFYQVYVVLSAIKSGEGIIYPLGLVRFPKILFQDSGYIGVSLALLGLILYLWKFRKNLPEASRKVVNYLVLPAAVIFYLCYTSKSRLEPNYLIPYLPFYLVFAAIFLDQLYRSRAGKKAALAIMVLSLAWLGGLALWIDYGFLNDTRYQARAWLEKNIPSGSRIETTTGLFKLSSQYDAYLIDWSYYTPLPPRQLVLLVRKLENKILAQSVDLSLSDYDRYEKEWQAKLDDYLHRFSMSGLKERNPDYIIASSRLYNRYLNYPNRYPSTKKYWEELLAGKYNYQIIKRFDRPPLIGLTGNSLCPEIVILKRVRE